jgi:hypothetical protein
VFGLGNFGLGFDGEGGWGFEAGGFLPGEGEEGGEEEDEEPVGDIYAPRCDHFRSSCRVRVMEVAEPEEHAGFRVRVILEQELGRINAGTPEPSRPSGAVFSVIPPANNHGAGACLPGEGVVGAAVADEAQVGDAISPAHDTKEYGEKKERADEGAFEHGGSAP